MKITMSKEVHDKIMYWVDKADFEVSGFGTVKYEDSTFKVTDAILLKQEGGATHTDIDPTSLSKAQYELRNADGDLRFWWHSHVNMNAFMSGTDKATVQEIAQQGWCVALVFNKRREYESALGYIYETPFGGRKIEYAEKIPFSVLQEPMSAELIAQLDAEYSAHVTEKKYTSFASMYDNTWNRWDEYDKGATARRASPNLPLLSGIPNINEITPELAEEARILGIKPKKWLKMCNTKPMDELDQYFEFINAGLTISEGFKMLKVQQKEGQIGIY